MEQLQQTLNEAIGMWWKPWNMKSVSEAFCQEWWMDVKYWDDWVDYCDRWYHDLFSKDSWLMEFMKWSSWSDVKSKYSKAKRNTERHYRNMSIMSAQEKINYFNTNAYLPWKQ